MRACRWQVRGPGSISVAGRAWVPSVDGGVCGFAPGRSTPSVMAFSLGFRPRRSAAWQGAGARQALTGVSGAPAARAAA